MRFVQSFGRIRHLLKKEFIQTLRDPHTRWLMFGPPILQMLIFGYAATLEVRHVTTAVLDLDRTQESRDLVSRLAGSRYFDVRTFVERRDQLRDGIDRGESLVALEIDAGFAKRLRDGEGAAVQVLVDSSNSNTALVALGYLNQIGAQYARDYQIDQSMRIQPAAAVVPLVTIEPRPWFNEGLESRSYFVPGVIGNLMQMMVMMLTAFAIVREREIGTLEQIMVTPVRRWEFILGKTIPFFLIGLCDAILIAGIGTFWFGVPFRGSVVVLIAGMVIFLVAALGLGLLLSTLAKTQQQARNSAFFFTMPATTLSGFGTPISSMPLFFQRLTYINPLRHIIVVLRSVYLKGVGFSVLWPNLAAMAIFASALLGISILRFRKSLE
jgi:ABC-2 type transport system permease protein